jgi:hypothetical protein
MLPIPLISNAVPTTFGTTGTPPHVATLVRTIAQAGMFEASDLRTGSAGPARMVERLFARWAVQDKLPARQAKLPIGFEVNTAPIIFGHDRPMLFLTNTAVAARWYIGHPLRHWLGSPYQAVLEHAVAMLYDGLDALCYAPKPPEYLAWARAMWWEGGEGEAITKTVANSKNPMTNRNRLPLRRAFDTRYPRWMQAPQSNIDAVINFNGTHGRDRVQQQQIYTLRLALSAARHSRHLLPANAHKIPGYAPGQIACYLRHRHGDYCGRLIDNYQHRAQRNGYKLACFHGAWPLDTADDLIRARRGIAANTRLAQALIDLVNEIGDVATSSFLGAAY